MLTEIAPDLWTAEDVIRRAGWVRMPVRMTLARLPRGGLVVHSPIRLTEERLRAVARIDKVEYVLAPNCLHHRFVGEWLRRFAGAKLYGVPGLGKKRKDLHLAGVLGENGPSPWAGVLEQQLIEGAPGVNEVVFLHRPSRTLLVTDLLYNIPKPTNFITRLVLDLNGKGGGLAMGRSWRRHTKDRQALRASVEKMLAWDFARILPAHGAVYQNADAPRRAQAALAWALEPGRTRSATDQDLAST